MTNPSKNVNRELNIVVNGTARNGQLEGSMSEGTKVHPEGPASSMVALKDVNLQI